MSIYFDYLIIGSGYAGLSAAALLSREGFSVCVLEAHTTIGGCASFYRKNKFTFDVGATTLSGVLPDQPVGKLFSELNISPKLKKVDPGLIIKISGKEMIRYADKEKWIEAAKFYFNSAGQQNFWENVFKIDKMAWEFISNNSYLPPNNIFDLIKLARIKNLHYSRLLTGLFSSVQKILNKYELSDPLFNLFIDEQLLITTQNTKLDAPFLTAAMGLAYPSETYYPYGGMYKPALEIMRVLKSNSGEIKFNRKVNSLDKKKDYYEVKTENGETFFAKGVLSSVPIWNMVELTSGEIQNYYQKYSDYFDFAWGAFTLNFAIETKVDLPSNYYQIHTEENIPNCDAKSFFVSFSEKNDFEKAPEGWRTITISCHTKVYRWQNITKETYGKQKEVTEKFIISKLFEEIPQLENSKLEWLLSGTPLTFEHYTQRKNGFVGGIPHSISKNWLKMPPNQTPFTNLYQIGDTAFPGQGTPGVILGALSTIRRILN